MSGKLDGLKALNTSPRQNPFCQARFKNDVGICGKCYSQKMVRTYRANADKVWQRNGEILSSCIIPDVLLPVINCAFFRYSAHGELINENHLINLLNIAYKNPHCNFTLWTKRDKLFNKVITEHGKPENLIAIFSATDLNIVPKIPANFDKVFCVFDYDTLAVNCENRCITCLKCYTHNNIDVIVERLK